jgi:hypothetical protein
MGGYMSELDTCRICGDEKYPQAHFCKRCGRVARRLDTRHAHDREARVQALKAAWDGSFFRCYYSGVRLVDDDPRSPLYLTFDHRTPRVESDVVVTAALFNDMKSDLSEEEFRTVVGQLAAHFAGADFDEGVLQLRYWKR